MASLESPADTSSLYGARRPDVERLRPVMQGDVFENLDIPGIEFGLGLAALLTHACTMRTTGGALRPSLLVARVVEHQHVPPEAWPSGHFRVLPLPEVRPDHPGESLAIHFEQIGTVPSSSLDVAERLAYLSDYGVTVLQQRFVHHLSRVVVDLPVLHAQAAPNFEEAALLHEWLDLLVPDPTVADDVSNQTREFDELLSANGEGLRQLLHDAVTRADARRRLRAEMKARVGN